VVPFDDILHTEEQAKIIEGSLVSQRLRLEEYVENQNLYEKSWGSIVGVYIDEGKSAKDMNRPEFQRMLTDVKAGKLDLILASELSRLSRSIRDFCEIWDLFQKHKVSMITLRDNFDTTTAAGEMMMFNMINYAQYERKQTGERIVANFQSRAKRGLWNGGVIPIGYRRDVSNPGKLLVDEVESKIIQEIFRLFLEKKNLNETCRELNLLGYRTKKNKGHYTVPSLYKLITNQTYLGMREVNKRKSQAAKEKITLVDAQWKPLIEKNVFDRVQKILEGNRRRFKPMEFKTYAYPLTGIATCGECGLRLNRKSAHGKNKKHHYYDHARTLKGNGTGHKHSCRIQRLRAERVEVHILDVLKLILAEPERAKLAVQAYFKNSHLLMPELNIQVVSVDKEIVQLKRRETNLMARISDLPPEVNASSFYKSIAELQKQIGEKAFIKNDLQVRQTKFNRAVTPESILERVNIAVKNLEKASKEDQRTIFENTFDFVEFHPTRIRLGIYTPGLFTGSTTIEYGGDKGEARKRFGLS